MREAGGRTENQTLKTKTKQKTPQTKKYNGRLKPLYITHRSFKYIS